MYLFVQLYNIIHDRYVNLIHKGTIYLLEYRQLLDYLYHKDLFHVNESFL